MYEVNVGVEFGTIVWDTMNDVKGRLTEYEVCQPGQLTPEGDKFALYAILSIPKTPRFAEYKGDYAMFRSVYPSLRVGELYTPAFEKPIIHTFKPKFECGDMVRSIANPGSIYGTVFSIKIRNGDITYVVLHPEDATMSINISEQWLEPMGRPNIFKDKSALSGMGFGQ